MLFDEPIYKILGDRGILIEFGDSINEKTKKRVNEMEIALSQERIDGVIETIPGYSSLLVVYDPLRVSFEALNERVKGLGVRLKDITLEEPRVVEVPVLYGGEYGPDLDFVAKYHSLTPEEVVRIHTSVMYTIYVLGTTGFAYLGELSELIQTPRLKTPRALVAPGSIGIGNNQTGIYAVEGPSGWQIIGKTTLQIYDPTKEVPVLLRPNDKVRFIPLVRANEK